MRPQLRAGGTRRPDHEELLQIGLYASCWDVVSKSDHSSRGATCVHSLDSEFRDLSQQTLAPEVCTVAGAVLQIQPTPWVPAVCPAGTWCSQAHASQRWVPTDCPVLCKNLGWGWCSGSKLWALETANTEHLHVCTYWESGRKGSLSDSGP